MLMTSKGNSLSVSHENMEKVLFWKGIALSVPVTQKHVADVFEVDYSY